MPPSPKRKTKTKGIASLRTIQWIVESTQKNTLQKVQKGREKNDNKRRKKYRRIKNEPIKREKATSTFFISLKSSLILPKG